jgi:alpha-galactosidase
MRSSDIKLFGTKIAAGVFRHEEAGLRFDYQVEPLDAGWLVRGSVKGTGGRVAVVELPAADPCLVHNWQSWGPVDWRAPGSSFEKLDVVFEQGRQNLFTPVPDVFRRSLVSDYLWASRSFLAGWLSSGLAHPYFVVGAGTVTGYLDFFGAPLAEGTRLEPLVLLPGDAEGGLLERYADLAGRENEVVPPDRNPVGWCSWYHYFTKVTWPDILKNLDLARGRYPFEVFQVDDGYERDIGDWLDRRPPWPELSEMAAEIAARGFTPGIWTAPFSFSETSRLFAEHPDWAVSEAGRPKPCYRGWGKTIYALDTTRPEVLDWLGGLFGGLRRAGFHYFKIDFLFAGAMPGRRSADVSPVAAYRRGLRVIREAAGRDFILACGAPLLPSAGLVDGMRVGEDTAPFWKPDLAPLEGVNAYHALRNPLLRQFFHRRLWLNDPDCVLLRGREIDLAPNERKLYAVVCGALDNMIVDSDDLALVDQAGFDLLLEALNLRGGLAAVRPGPARDTFIVHSSGGPAGEFRLLANLSDSQQVILKEIVPARTAVLVCGSIADPAKERSS